MLTEFLQGPSTRVRGLFLGIVPPGSIPTERKLSPKVLANDRFSQFFRPFLRGERSEVIKVESGIRT
jgi:hypothetical protein